MKLKMIMILKTRLFLRAHAKGQANMCIWAVWKTGLRAKSYRISNPMIPTSIRCSRHLWVFSAVSLGSLTNQLLAHLLQICNSHQRIQRNQTWGWPHEPRSYLIYMQAWTHRWCPVWPGRTLLAQFLWALVNSLWETLFMKPLWRVYHTKWLLRRSLLLPRKSPLEPDITSTINTRHRGLLNRWMSRITGFPTSLVMFARRFSLLPSKSRTSSRQKLPIFRDLRIPLIFF